MTKGDYSFNGALDNVTFEHTKDGEFLLKASNIRLPPSLIHKIGKENSNSKLKAIDDEIEILVHQLWQLRTSENIEMYRMSIRDIKELLHIRGLLKSDL